MKLPEKLPPVPRLVIVNAAWSAVCGRCMRRSCVVHATDPRDAWNEIASAEGWTVYEPPAISGVNAEPYPVCLQCVEVELSPPLARRARRKR